MSERLPYEQQLPHQWDALPLPDINLAWADMKRRLEDDDDRRPVAWWRRGCMLWGFLLLALAGTGWWIFRPDKWFDKKGNAPSITRTTSGSDPDNNGSIPVKTSADTIATVLQKKNKEQAPLITVERTTLEDSLVTSPGNQTVPLEEKIKTGKANNVKNERTKRIKEVSKSLPEKNRDPSKKELARQEGNKPVKTEPVKNNAVLTNKKDSIPAVDRNIIRPDTLVAVAKKDSVRAVDKKADPTVVKKTEKKDTVKNKPSMYFSAGIAMHQQLPVDGQSFVPYSSLGRKGSLMDYIPSAYFRVNRDKKWFIQTGFRYGAPQLVKEVFYKSKADTISQQKYNTTNSYLKKTFYHQVPLTFNYFIVPGWSMGAGIVWNKFAGAVSSQDVIQTDIINGGDTAIAENVIIGTRKADSSFAKSWLQATFETQYKWKRFSFGVNYSFGLQPYIRFYVPNGPLQEEKNSSLHLFIRYELWRSKK